MICKMCTNYIDIVPINFVMIVYIRLYDWI